MKTIRRQWVLIILAVTVLAASAFAADDQPGLFDYQIRNSKQRSSAFWFPLLSGVVPGLDQYLNGQRDTGIMYSSIAGVGVAVAVIGASRHDFDAEADSSDFTGLTVGQEEYLWGSQVYQDIGFLSAYHAFRSVAKQRQAHGDFQFLNEGGAKDETADQLMLAPFHFQYLARPTTLAPLAVVALLGVLQHNQASSFNYLNGTDAAFSLGTSYNAGVSEEAFFRGYLMMNMRQSWSSDIWSNLASSTVFAAAHISPDNPLPLPQFVLGTYLAWLAQHNQWTLSEGVFIHAWWDVLAITASLIDNSTVHRAVMLPPFTVTF